MAETASQRARLRIREEMARRKLSQRDVAGILQWTQSRVSKNLNARIELGVDDLESLCFAVGISLVEAVRDHGLEFCADMTPSELRTLHALRQTTEAKREGIMALLEVKTKTYLPERHAGSLRQNKVKRRALS